jgi:polar amino acid transport system permease protein
MSIATERPTLPEEPETPEDRRQARLARVTQLVGGGGLALIVLGLPILLLIGGVVPYKDLLAGFLSGPAQAFLLSGIGLGIIAIILGFTRYKRMPTKVARERAIAGGVLGIQAVVLAGILLAFRELGNPDPFFRNFLNFKVIGSYWDDFVRAGKNTVQLAFVGEAGGIVLGLLLAVLLLSKRPVVRAPARVYCNFFRGTPLIWQLSAFYFAFSLGLGLHFDAFTVAMIVFVLNTGAYASEVFRAGIQSIERGQMEAARSLGMSYPQAMRHAIVPQAVRRVIPPLMNEFVILIKDTALVVVLGLLVENYEIYTVAREGYSNTYNATFYVVAAAAYLVVTLPLIRAVNAVEKRLRSGLVTVTS